MKIKFILISVLFLIAPFTFSQNGLEVVYNTTQFDIRQFNSFKLSGNNDKRIFVQFKTNTSLQGGEYKKLNKSSNILNSAYNGFLDPHHADLCYGNFEYVPIEIFVVSPLNEQVVAYNTKVSCDTSIIADETNLTLNGGVSANSVPVSNSAGIDISINESIYTAGTADFFTYSIYKSTNRGNSWFICNELTDLKKISKGGFIKCSPTDSGKVYITGKNNLYMSTNSGNNFFNTNAPSFDKIYFKQNKMYGIISNRLYTSSDNGLTWIKMYSSLVFDFTCLEFSSDEAQTIFAGTNLGVFKSLDDGVSWNIYNNAFPESNYILGLSKDPVSNSYLYACTKKGIYKVLNEHYVPLNFISPFKVGNYFEYTYQFPTTYSYYKKVLKDTIFNNGKRYYKFGTDESYTFEFLDTISLKWYRYDPYCPDSNSLLIDLLADSGHIFRKCETNMNITKKGIANNWFGDTTRVKYSKSYIYPPYFFHSQEETYSEKFGFFSSVGYVFNVFLTGAIIDGITYGVIVTSVNNVSNSIPGNFILHQNFPNPFNPTTKIKFDIPNSLSGDLSIVRLKIYDALGKEVQTLVNEKLSPGSYETEFNGSNLSSGMYFYKLESGDFVETKRMILIK